MCSVNCSVRDIDTNCNNYYHQLIFQAEAESQKMRNLLTFRKFKDFYEEAKSSADVKYQELINSCVQDCIFLSSKNSELLEENTNLKKKIKGGTN